jgi:glycosyltransferase involved in cell wall biosynthesis
MDSLTVVIPTFNRSGVLKLALDGYLALSEPKTIEELIVVDDGSTDETEATVAEVGRISPFPVRYLRQSNSGPAAARNYGIREARSEVILFTDSDIAPDKDLVAQHLEWHDKHPQENVAVLGYVTWPAQPAPTPFMRWYGERQLFAYGRIHDQQQVAVSAFYSCNLSLKTSFLKAHGQFDERFKTAAYEDLELGHRLGKAGLQLLYNRHAIAYHHQVFTFEDACRKVTANSAAMRTFFQTDYGRSVLEAERKRRSRLRYRLARGAATAGATAIAPAKRLVDANLPVPSAVYRLLFWRCATTSLPSNDPAAP